MENAPKAMNPPSARGSSSEYGWFHSRPSASTTVGKTSITRWSSRCPRLMKGTRKRRSFMDASLPLRIHRMDGVSGIGISGIILAGGLGRRMGGVDKALQPLRGKPMVQHVIERLAPQVGEIVINANQNAATYAKFGHRVVADDIAGYAGPLAGLHAGMKASQHPLVVTVPCDSPFLPADLVSRLKNKIGAADLAVAKTGDQPHPVFSLMRTDLLSNLEAFL